MKCDVKTMLKGGLGLAALIAVAYAALPVAREWIATVSPFLFFLICPLMMLFMMKGMQSCHSDNASKNGGPTQAQIPEGTNAGGHSRPPAPANRFDA
ncbi:DUF2933 domain-containing protein [Eoetvoesiella caeni]|uniref:DUF2933 family protein n=1 Tax=Eoetvoesiella caeni TaxID=645616 RepID=A0A366HEJ8_9BURK|nr:DUF2933 domain-containing protein [Eoetvoesiella caeni]MCI2808856.1 DUF2933 domain-containing protein [Eoetvoesiella caeni]NYT55643.1 DUF2933 domain-containing protein [Eoetvoesiella caeni]RBP40202.1 DUF2933 family protein [Eoetvoesiella caeni]